MRSQLEERCGGRAHMELQLRRWLPQTKLHPAQMGLTSDIAAHIETLSGAATLH
jgi:hypothetical protein